VVVANILAEVLVKLFDGAYGNTPLADPLAPGGTMILSGILEDRAALVEEAAVRHGLSIVTRYQEGDWVAIVAQSSPA
jgi:ribosomal protein L11 methyltransferase